MIKLSGYKIIKKIGSGGMGDVFLAEHKVLENIVAIKSLHPNLVKDEVFRKRFKSEAKIHSKLNHPNVVKLIDFQERKDGLFIIMEYVEGQQLDDYIKNVSGPINENELIPLFTQIVDAISHAHSKGLIHRDIKPANIIISENKIKVLDFGIAKEISEESGLTKTGVQVGTPMYMSPEQVNGEKVDKLTDIYSLGVTLFYMAVGKAPYKNSNAIKMGVQILTEDFPDAKKFYPGISFGIEKIIKKATQKNKKERYQSCEELKQDLSSKNFKDKITTRNTQNDRIRKKSISDEQNSYKKKRNRYILGFCSILFIVCIFSLNNQDSIEKEIPSNKKNKEKKIIQLPTNKDRESKAKMEREYELKRKTERQQIAKKNKQKNKKTKLNSGNTIVKNSSTVKMSSKSQTHISTKNNEHNEINKEDEEYYMVVENMPEFPGGDLALMKFIKENVRYPAEAKEYNITGKVYVSFIVDKQGNVTDVKIVRGADKNLDAEALRVVSSLPRYKPGKQRGEPVRVMFTIPINFNLN